MTTTVSLRIVGENGQVVGTIRATKKELAALGADAAAAGRQAQEGGKKVDGMGEAAERTARRTRATAQGARAMGAAVEASGRQAERAGRQIDGAGAAAERSRRGFGLLSGTLGDLRGILAGYVGLQGLRALVASVDTYSDVVGKLKQATKGEAELAAAKAKTFEISQKYFQELDATVTLYGRASRALEQYGYSQQTVSKLTETVSAGLLVDRATVQESASAMLQLSQALGAGALRGEEFNAVNEAAPSIMRALADSLDVPIGKLRQMAEDGALTVDVLVDAWTGARADAIIKGASNVPLTIGRAWQNTRNEIVRYLGEIDQSIGASRGAAEVVLALGRNLNVVATVAVTVATVYGVRLVQSLILSTRQFVVNTAAAGANTVGLYAAGGAAARLTTAQTAAAVASRGLSAALAFVGGPIGLLVVGVAALATGFATAGNSAEENSERIRNAARTAKTALDDFNARPNPQKFSALADANVGQSIKEAREELARLKADAADASTAYMRAIARNFDGAPQAARVRELSKEMEFQKLRVDELTKSYDQAIRSTADMVLEQMRISRVTPESRKSLEDLVRELDSNGIALDTARPKFLAWAEAAGIAGAEARVTAASFREMNAAASDTKYLDQMSEQLQKQQVRLRAIQQGVRAGSRLEFGQQILADQKERGKPFTEAELAARYRAWQAVANATDEADAAQRRAAESKRAATASSREHTKSLRDEARAQVTVASAMNALKSLVRDQQNQYGDDQVRADNDYADSLQRIQKVEDDLRRVRRLDAEAIRQLADARDQASKAHAYALEVARQEMDIVGRIKEDYREQIQLSGLSGEARRAEEVVIRAVNEAKQQGRTLSAGEIQDLRKFARESEATLRVRDAQVRYAEEVQGAWVGAASSASQAFADFAANGFKDFKSFSQALKDIAKRLVSDLIRIFADRALIQPLQNWFSQLMSGGSGGFGQAGGGGGFWNSIISAFTGRGNGGNGGGFWSTVFSAFGGGGGARGGGTGGGMWSSLLSAFGGGGGGLWSSIGSLFGLGGGGATASAAGFASGVGSGAAGAGGAGASAGIGAAGAVAWIAAIVMGMYLNSQWWKEGWRAEGQKTDLVKYPASKGLIFASVDHAAVMGAHNLLRALGVNDKWAAILSGSSGIARAFGHKKPEIKGTGIVGSIGFGGFDGQSYADIKQRGGWFRSDRRWTQYGAINSSIDFAFDAAASSVRTRALDIATQMGVDITAALGTIKIDLGKIQLDKDPEKARAQIQAEIERMMEALSAAAIKTLGFERLLDDGFQASEQMGALSASIALVTGGADRLGRALTALEKENVTRAVEWFQAQSLRDGASLTDTVARVTGQLGEYAGLISGVDTQLRTRGLNQYQQAQLQIELRYREQIKQANDLAKALGLSGARAEDLAKIEQLRAVSMADLQRQMEEQRNAFLSDLSLSELSPLRDDQKLGDSMRMFREAVSANDMQRAQQLSQTVLGFGRNLFASGADYNALYDEVTRLLMQVGINGTAGLTDTQLDEIADILTGLPEQIARAMFALMYGPTNVLNPPPPPPPPNQGGGGNVGTGGNGNRGGGIGIGDNRGSGRVLVKMLQTAEQMERHMSSVATTNQRMASVEERRELRGVGEERA
jgi:tape measure domain-containing protein